MMVAVAVMMSYRILSLQLSLLLRSCGMQSSQPMR